jgi:CRISPR-associated protein Csx3
LTPSDEAHAFWQALVERHGLVLLADLRSDLHGDTRMEANHPLIRGTLAGLHAHYLATGAVIEALAGRVADLFTSYDPEELRQLRLNQAPVEMVLELDRYAQDATSSAEKYWRPESLPGLVSVLPAQTPLGLYGRAPNWVYGAVAAATAPAPLVLFDVRLGWRSVPELHLDPAAATYGTRAASGLAWWLHSDGERAVLEMTTLPGALELGYEQIGACPFPTISPGQGLICSGRMSNWLWIGLARCYQQVPWLACYQLQADGAVIIVAHDEHWRVGERIAFTLPLL